MSIHNRLVPAVIGFWCLSHNAIMRKKPSLTLKAPIMTAADDKFCDIFPNSRKKYGMIFHENRLPADDSYEISCLICYFEKATKF